MVAREYHNILQQSAAGVLKDPVVVPHCICRPLEPMAGFGRPGGCQHLHREAIAHRPAVGVVSAGDVPVEGGGVVLREHINLPQAAVDAVGDGDVHQAVNPANRYRRLGAELGQRMEALALPAAQNDGWRQ